MKSNKGQSTIEFLFTMVFTIGFIFFFINISFNYTNGYIVQIANFMASRAYLVIDNNSSSIGGADSQASSKAQAVFDSYNIGSIISNFNGSFNVNEPEAVKAIFIGTWVQYEPKFSFSSLFGGTGTVRLRSESFLGREPTRGECAAQVCEAMRDLAPGSACERQMTLYDNGC